MGQRERYRMITLICASPIPTPNPCLSISGSPSSQAQYPEASAMSANRIDLSNSLRGQSNMTWTDWLHNPFHKGSLERGWASPHWWCLGDCALRPSLHLPPRHCFIAFPLISAETPSCQQTPGMLILWLTSPGTFEGKAATPPCLCTSRAFCHACASGQWYRPSNSQKRDLTRRKTHEHNGLTTDLTGPFRRTSRTSDVAIWAHHQVVDC